MEIENKIKSIEITLNKEVLIANPNPDTIAYVPDFLAVHNNHIQQMPVSVFEAMIRTQPERSNFCWSEKLTVAKSSINTRVTVAERYIDKQFSSTIDGLVIFNMGAQLGNGVATLRPIKQGTIITYYAGRIISFSTHKITMQDVMSAYRMNYDSGCIIDAREIGNIASFIQDGPDEQELAENYLIEPAIAAKIAVANVFPKIAIFRGQKVVAVIAARDINPGEMLVINYGSDYWNKLFLICNKSRLLYTQTADIISAESYQYTGIKLKIKYDNQHFVNVPYSALIKAAEKQQLLRYSFVPNNGLEEIKELSFDDVKLIADKSLWTTVIADDKFFVKEYIMHRLQKEYRLRNLLFPLSTVYNIFFLREGERLRKEGNNSAQAIAYLLQALLLALKEDTTVNELAAIYLASGLAYADEAKKAQNIICMEIAIYLLKQSIKLAPIQKCIVGLQDSYDWWLNNKLQMSDKKTISSLIYTSVKHYWYKFTFKCFCLFYNRNR